MRILRTMGNLAFGGNAVDPAPETPSTRPLPLSLRLPSRAPRFIAPTPPVAPVDVPASPAGVVLTALSPELGSTPTLAQLEQAAFRHHAALPFFADAARLLVNHARASGLVGARMRALELALRTVPAHPNPQRAEDYFLQALQQGERRFPSHYLRTPEFHSPRWHSLGIVDHSMVAVAAMRELKEYLPEPWPTAEKVALLHDVGKLLKRRSFKRAGGQRFGFSTHSQDGAAWMRARQFDPGDVYAVDWHVGFRSGTLKEILQGAGGDKRWVSRLLVLYISDQVAKGCTPAQMRSFQEQVPKFQALGRLLGMDVDSLLRQAVNLRRQWFPGTQVVEKNLAKVDALRRELQNAAGPVASHDMLTTVGELPLLSLVPLQARQSLTMIARHADAAFGMQGIQCKPADGGNALQLVHPTFGLVGSFKMFYSPAALAAALQDNLPVAVRRAEAGRGTIAVGAFLPATGKEELLFDKPTRLFDMRALFRRRRARPDRVSRVSFRRRELNRAAF